MGAADPTAGAAAADAGGKSGGGAGAGDPFSSFGGSSGFDPTSMFGGDSLGGLGGGFGTTTSSPGGNIAEAADVQGDPTGAVQAQQTMQAGAPTPGTPGGGIGGAQSNAGTPSGPAQLAQAQQPASFNQRYQGLPPTGQELTPQEPIDQNIPKTTGPGSGTPQQFGPAQPPASFGQRFGDPQAASFDQRFGTGNMAQPGPQAAQLAQSGIANPPPGVSNIPGQMAGTPNVDATQQAGPAAAPAAAPAPAATPGTATPDTGAGAATGAGKTPAAADTTDASSTGGRDSFSDRYTGGQGGQGGQGMQQFNPMALISALLRGGPMGALSELARQASGQGMMQPSLPGGGAPGRSGGPYGAQPAEPPERTASESTSESPQAQTPEQQAQAAQQAQTAQAAAAGQEAPGVAPSSTGLPQGNLPARPAGNLQQPPAWAQQAAGQTGQPNVNAAQSASLGATSAPGMGTNAATDRWVSPQHVSMNRNAGTNTPGTPGYSSTMRAARAPYFDQLRPQDRTLLYGMMNAENERDPIGPMESLANRAAASHMSMRRILDSGFYGPRSSFLRRGLAIQNSGRAAHYDSVINAVRNGSNVLGGATDQGSGHDPNVGHRGGRILRSGEVYNDWGGGRGHAANASWREQIQARVRAENAANPPRPPAPIPNVNTPRAQRVGEGSPIASFGPGSMGQGNIAEGWRRSSNVENVNQPTFDERFEGGMGREEARVRKGNYEASLPGYQAPPSQLAQQLGLGDITIDQITQLLGQLQQAPPQ